MLSDSSPKVAINFKYCCFHFVSRCCSSLTISYYFWRVTILHLISSFSASVCLNVSTCYFYLLEYWSIFLLTSLVSCCKSSIFLRSCWLWTSFSDWRISILDCYSVSFYKAISSYFLMFYFSWRCVRLSSFYLWRAVDVMTLSISSR